MSKHTPTDMHVKALRVALTNWTAADRDYVVNAYRAHDALVSALERALRIMTEQMAAALKLAKGE